MELKFYLNKFLKVDNIEKYTLSALDELRKIYDKFTDSTGGFDPDFPMMSVGGKGEKSEVVAKGKNNVYNLAKDGESVEDVKNRASLGYDNEGFTLTK